jgi:nucleotide-binding universal stress UspA family protein
MLDIQKILFPTDFSRCSRQAFAHALFLAEQHEATLQLFHAVILHEDDPVDPERHFPESKELLETMFEIADSQLAALVELHEEHPVTLQEFRTRGLSPAGLILEHAREHDVDLIVMGTHGRRGASRFLLGSVATQIVRVSPVPVLTLRELDDGRPLEALDRILVPIDFSSHSRVALRHATELARTYGASLQLLHVVQQPNFPYFYAPVPAMPPIEQLQSLHERGREALQKLVAEAGDASLRHRLEIFDGHPASEIVTFAEENGSDLIVTASHGLTGLDRLLLGSTSEQVVRTSSVPVLLVKSFGKSLVPEETVEVAEPAPLEPVGS